MVGQKGDSRQAAGTFSKRKQAKCAGVLGASPQCLQEEIMGSDDLEAWWQKLRWNGATVDFNLHKGIRNDVRDVQ